jgi:negative regulator of sigma E activity
MQQRAPRWWRPMAGAAVAASVAAVAVVALQQRANPNARRANRAGDFRAPARIAVAGRAQVEEPLLYDAAALPGGAPRHAAGAADELRVCAQQVFQSVLGQRDVLTDLLVDADEQTPAAADCESAVIASGAWPGALG